MASKRRKSTEAADGSPSPRIDVIDRRILRGLAARPRQSTAQLAHEIGLSRPATADRVRRLERDGVIAGWRVDLNPAALGLPFTVFIRIRPSAGQAMAVEGVVQRMPEVVECYRTTGEESLFLKVHVSTVPAFEALLSRLQRYGQTVASDVLSAVVRPRAPSIVSLDPE